MKHHTLNYVEFDAKDLAKTREFYGKAFGWTFTDYGPSYLAFKDGNGFDGGFTVDSSPGTSPLAILYSENLTATRDAVAGLGGKIVKDIYEFPGGKRFHFEDPNGNELAVWSEK